MRVPLAVNLESRDGGTSKDALGLNAIAEVKGEGDIRFRKRPGVADLGAVDTGTAQLLVNWNGVNAIIGDSFNRGTITTIVSAPTSTNLSPANTGLQWQAAATNNDASTPRLMFKNRTQAKYINRAGTISSITYADNMGAGTYSVISITRSGTTATATIAEDVFNVGDTVTIAGADQAAYNGAQTVTAITAGSSTPGADVTISSLTRSGTTATAVATAHGLTNGVSYTIAGANQSAYNKSATVTVVDANTFTYSVTVTPATTTKWNSADKASGITLSNSDKTGSGVVANLEYEGARGNVSKSGSGKWYFEITIDSESPGPSADDYLVLFGAAGAGVALSGSDWTAGGSAFTADYVYFDRTQFTGDSLVGDVLGVALDLDSGSIKYYINNTLANTRTGVSGTLYPYFAVASSTAAGSGPTAKTIQVTGNFGATAFTYTPPSGYVAWQSDDPVSPASGSPKVTRPTVTVNPTFSYTVAGSPATPATGTITAASDGGTVPGIAYINGYFVVMDLNGVIWHSDQDDPSTWGATAFTTAEVENGAAVALAESMNYLIALKQWSTEPFYDAQNASGSVFSPVDNGFTRVGCAQGFSVAETNKGIAWIAQTQQEGRSVYFMLGLEQRKISTPDIDRILNADDLATVYAFGLELDGHPLYVLTLTDSNLTLVYDFATQMWGPWSSYTLGSSKSVSSITRDGDIATVNFGVAHTLSDGDPVLLAGADQNEYNGIFQASYVDSDTIQIVVSGAPTTPATGTITGKPYTESYFKFTKAMAYAGATYFLHETDGHLYKLLPSLKRDAGLPINWFARTTRMDGGDVSLKRLAALAVVGDSVNDVCMVRWSDDDCATFSAYKFVDLSQDRPITRKCGGFRRRTIEFRHVGNTSPALAALELDIA